MPLKKGREMYPNMKTLGVNAANFRKVGKEEGEKMKKEMEKTRRRQKITGAILQPLQKYKGPTPEQIKQAEKRREEIIRKFKGPPRKIKHGAFAPSPQERDQLKGLADRFSKRIPFL